MARKKRSVKATDLYKFQTISDPQISPDGTQVVYCVHRVDEKTEKKYSNLWVVATEGGKPRQFTFGDQNDSHPRWSPDGKTLAFLSNRGGAKGSQIYVLPVAGGESRKLTDMKGRIMTFAWSPNGKRFAVQFAKMDEEVMEREKDEQKRKLGVVERHITRVFFKFDGGGYLPKEKPHLWMVNARTGKAKQLTEGDKAENVPSWSPDGKTILFTSNRSDDPDFNMEEVDLYTIPAKGGEMSRIESDHAFQKFMPSYSPDGQWIAYYGRRMRANWWQNACLYVVPAGGGTTHNLTEKYDLHMSSTTNGDVSSSPALKPPVWSPDGQTITIMATRHGEQPLYRIDRESGELETLVETGVNGAIMLSADGSKMVYQQGHFTDPGQLFVCDMEKGKTRQLTSLNSKLLKRLELAEIEEVKFKGKDGYELEGWIVKPAGFDPKQTYPSIMEIHGGPQTQYGKFFMHEFYMLAAAGYVVYFSNPRGSQGYGDNHAGAIYNNWGTVDYDDVMAWADYMAEKPYIDTERMGVTGGSYGGYMTTTIIGRSDRFKAAVAQRLVSNMISMWGSSDFNWGWTEAMGGETPWENLENYWRQSPISGIGGAKTPTLIIHSERDYRCNLEQAEQVYVALRKQGIDSEMVLFPEESHGLSRGGRTDRRVARLKHIQRWFDKYLK